MRADHGLDGPTATGRFSFPLFWPACAGGAAPATGTFVFFGIATFWVSLLALSSIGRLQQALGPKGRWLLRLIGLNYIADAFAVDFLNNPLHESARHVIESLPFAVLAVAGPALRLAAFALRLEQKRQGSSYRTGWLIRRR